MTLEYICNEDMKLHFVNPPSGIPPSVPPDAIYTGDPGIDLVKVVPTLSTSCKAVGKWVAIDKAVITWTLATGGCPFTSVLYNFVAGAAQVQSSAIKVKADSKPVLRDGDTSLIGCKGTWTLKASPFTTVNCECSVDVSDAGQTKARAQ